MKQKQTWKHSTRPVVVTGDVCEITLADGSKAYCDAADAELVGRWNWHRSNSPHDTRFTVRRATNPGYMVLADLINPPPPGLTNDHIDRNPRNNRRSNLRFATAQQNCQNRMRPNKVGFKGVGRHGNRFRARIVVDGRRIILGSFVEPIAAARAYDAAAIHYFGEFAALNLPDELRQPKSR